MGGTGGAGSSTPADGPEIAEGQGGPKEKKDFTIEIGGCLLAETEDMMHYSITSILQKSLESVDQQTIKVIVDQIMQISLIKDTIAAREGGATIDVSKLINGGSKGQRAIKNQTGAELLKEFENTMYSLISDILQTSIGHVDPKTKIAIVQQIVRLSEIEHVIAASVSVSAREIITQTPNAMTILDALPANIRAFDDVRAAIVLGHFPEFIILITDKVKGSLSKHIKQLAISNSIDKDIFDETAKRMIEAVKNRVISIVADNAYEHGGCDLNQGGDGLAHLGQIYGSTDSKYFSAQETIERGKMIQKMQEELHLFTIRLAGKCLKKAGFEDAGERLSREHLVLSMANDGII